MAPVSLTNFVRNMFQSFIEALFYFVTISREYVLNNLVWIPISSRFYVLITRGELDRHHDLFHF